MGNKKDRDAIPEDFAQYIEALMGSDAAKTVDALVSKKTTKDDRLRQRFNTSSKSKYEVGTTYKGVGCYVGIWEPYFLKGIMSTGYSFDIFAAPEDLIGKKTYQQAIEVIDGNPLFYGYVGKLYRRETHLYADIANKAYDGRWFLPLNSMVINHAGDSNGISNDMPQGNLFDVYNINKFNNSIMTGHPYWTGSLTKEGQRCAVVLSKGRMDVKHSDDDEAYVRLVRAVPRQNIKI